MNPPNQPQTTLLPIGIHYNLTREQYVADPGYNQSSIKALAKANSPAHYKFDLDHPTLQDKDYIRIGNFVDCAVFHPEQVGSRFAIWPGIRKGKAWDEFKDSKAGVTILNEQEHERALGTLKAIRGSEYASAAIDNSIHHAVVIANHPTLGYRLKAELDIVPDLALEWLWDLKTADDAGTEAFNKQAFSLSYDVQSVFYADILSYLPEPIIIQNFGFIVVETSPPHGLRFRHIKMDSPVARRAREKIYEWLQRYHECLSNNSWPSYSEASEEIVFKPWMMKEGYEEGEVLV